MIIIATEAHCGQKDKAGKPYILHSLWVMNMLAKTHSDMDLLCIAVGQDLLEDTDIDKLKSNGFKSRVVDGIISLTKQEDETYTQYRNKVLANKDAMRVKFYSLSYFMDLNRFPINNESDMVNYKTNKAFRDQIRSTLSDDRLIASP
jgi:(p)ppGpp synthase/HD superfamily hydrolase